MEKHPEMIPVSQYMRKDTNTIIRLEFPKSISMKSLEPIFRDSCVAWQHELGVKFHMSKNSQMLNVKSRQKPKFFARSASRLVDEGLETLEVYE